jgi:trehalose 6-phosphate synthase/phosphatase
MDRWFSQLPNVVLAAEHGAYLKRKGGLMWEQTDESASELMRELRECVLPIMEEFVESTDGAFVEEKEVSIVWHHGDADPDFGRFQASELVAQLQEQMLWQNATVVRGTNDVEVKPKGTSKRNAVEQAIKAITEPLDFMLLVGNDYESPEVFRGLRQQLPNLKAVYLCTVGQPTSASYYVDSVPDLLKGLTQSPQDMCIEG